MERENEAQLKIKGLESKLAEFESNGSKEGEELTKRVEELQAELGEANKVATEKKNDAELNKIEAEDSKRTVEELKVELEIFKKAAQEKDAEMDAEIKKLKAENENILERSAIESAAKSTDSTHDDTEESKRLKGALEELKETTIQKDAEVQQLKTENEQITQERDEAIKENKQREAEEKEKEGAEISQVIPNTVEIAQQVQAQSSAIIKEKVTALFEKVTGAFTPGEDEEDRQFTTKQITKKIKNIFRKELKNIIEWRKKLSDIFLIVCSFFNGADHFIAQRATSVDDLVVVESSMTEQVAERVSYHKQVTD